MTALVPGCRTVKCKVTGTPAFTAAGAVVTSSEYSRVSNGSPATSAIPHFRQRPPASAAVTSGCIGQNQAVVPGGAELCCAAAPSVSSATSTSVSLFRGIVIQREGESRTCPPFTASRLRRGKKVRTALVIRDSLKDRACGQQHRFFEYVRRRPQLMRVLHPEQHIAGAIGTNQLDLERSRAGSDLGSHRNQRPRIRRLEFRNETLRRLCNTHRAHRRRHDWSRRRRGGEIERELRFVGH